MPVEESAEIDDRTAGTVNGFGSVRVTVTIGATTRQTSIFPEAGRQGYALPVEKAVRVAVRLTAGESARVSLELRDPDPPRAPGSGTAHLR